MKPSHYDALLTFARLLSKVQSGAPKISWQKITPISKKAHQQAWKHLFYIIFFSLVVSGWALWNFSEQRTITLGMLFWAVLPGYALWVLKKEIRCHSYFTHAIGMGQSENFTLYFIPIPKGRYRYYPKNTLEARCGKYLSDWHRFTLADWQALLPDTPSPEDLQRLIHAIGRRLAN